MEHCCNLILETNIALLGFSVKTVLGDRNMLLSQAVSKSYEKMFYNLKRRHHESMVSFHNKNP